MSEVITAEAVEQFLLTHPDFLQNRHDLLFKLSLSAPKSSAVPLIEHQAKLLRERNTELRERLNTLLSTARDNDVLFEKTRQLILAMMQATTADDMAEQMKKQLQSQFGVDFVELFVFNDTFAGEHFRAFPHHEAHTVLGNLASNPSAVCGSLSERELSALFGEKASRVGSAVVQPFHYANNQGLVALGSKDPERYRSSIGTLFLAYVGEVAARMLSQLGK